ncbi:MAG TPA: glycosyltransferase [Gemmatimonadaceae bacterium]|nr:glycosyltransferase [Gemmatimonadaceae bacterium]
MTISSSWGNGHATLWRGLCRALERRGHQITFFERDVPYYAAHRDLVALDGITIELYPDWGALSAHAASEVAAADIAIVTSYCPDAIDATRLVADRARFSVFYDMDSPTTLEGVRNGAPPAYVGDRGLRDFDLVLSYTGGVALDELQALLGAKRVAPLYGSVDPDTHRPMPAAPQYAADLSYLGTYAADRQSALTRLFVDAARKRPGRRFVIGGAQYPEEFPWTDNIFFVRHLPPAEHPMFFCSSSLTLNVTRPAFASRGYCPSGRLFEAAACGTAVLSDEWIGLETFFTPGDEILLAHGTDDTLAALSLHEDDRRRIGARARERVLDEHTADHRAVQLESILDL